MDAELILNGIDATTGDYLLKIDAEGFASCVLGQELDPEELAALRMRLQMDEAVFGVMEGVDPKKLEEAGWGVIFAAGADQRLLNALKPLLDRRKSQAGDLYREFTNEKAYRPQARESKGQYLARLGAPTDGPVNPQRMPYYLLIVGDPETIPFSFQYQLDIQYAVGRIHFDTAEEYERYAQSVVVAETAKKRRPRKAALFGVQNPDDSATYYSATELVKPLAEYLVGSLPDWQVESLLEKDANKQALARLLGGPDTPAFLFTAGHGVGYPNGDANQFPRQGALLCQDWPGPKQWRGPIPEDHYFSAGDLAADADLSGLVAFHFACFGAGTPKRNDFLRFDEYRYHRYGGAEPATENAPCSFVAQLPQRLLAHPNGGALAVVGHIDRAWGYSFMGDDQFGRPMQIAQLVAYKSVLKRLLEGYPIGAALEPFNGRSAEIMFDLKSTEDDIKNGMTYDPMQLVSLWTSGNDSRNFVIVGDPAVRLAV